MVQNVMGWMKQQDRVVQDRCPDIMWASDGFVVVVLTEIRAAALVGVGGKVDSEGEVTGGLSLGGVVPSEGGPMA